MVISVINLSKLPDVEVQRTIRAVNRQIQEDFAPAWNAGAKLRLEGHSGRLPSKKNPVDMRGDAVLYIWDQVDVQQALGYHAHNFRGIPYGFVFPELSAALHQPWSHTLSHEALELIADPHCNLLVEGPHPHPRHRKRRVFRWYEVCDPVQDELYEIDGVAVSNFVTPLYFTEDDERGGRNAFHHLNEAELVSFGTNPGGYVGFYDPKEGKHDTWAPRHDDRAQAILALKAPYQTATRTSRRRRD